MNVSALCQRPVVTIDARAAVRAAARRMRDEHVGALVVVDERLDAPAAVVGVVTDRDLVVQALARDDDVDGFTLGSISSTKALAVPDTADVADTLATMRDEGVRRLLVVDGDRRLVGIVTIDDLIGALAVEMANLAEAVRGGPVREGTAKADPEPTPTRIAPLLPNGSMALRWRQSFPTA